MAKNVLLGESHFSDLATEKKFWGGEGSIIGEGLSYDICSQLVGLSGDVGFLGNSKTNLYFLGI